MRPPLPFSASFLIRSLHTVAIAGSCTIALASLCACDRPDTAASPTQAAASEAAAPQPDPLIRLSDDLRRDAGIQVAVAGPQAIAQTLPVHGELVSASDRVHRVAARYPGVARQIAKNIGDRVSKGETLVVVESNDSLEPYRIVSPGAGRVLERHVNVGEAMAEQTLFVIGDLSQVWAELAVFPRDAARLHPGMEVDVRLDRGSDPQRAKIDYIAPGTDAQRRIVVRATLDNSDGRWPPGAFVNAQLIVDERNAAVAVPQSAVQYDEGQPLVFIETDGGFAARPVRLGLQDRAHVEVLEGLSAGERVVIANSFLLKSEWLEGGHDD
ncbi:MULTISPECIES: efflux RND transporter periplasmic adaptor subunit [Hydrocarboniphaga]|jgi:cobalt-zinc-cadmium efflux system membrane fusion protein|uniref:Uncharacterized protein n=1 Tax=Hydrocarboniphaga effusa AP103 TaxID=1172194 RepID=I8TC06_9GAMM|nr:MULTISPECIES: efflux RND transporter periplasmic adaptor subunit [Hydrocarboniphaga]EIT71153.1 hypothetical protein WQQ_12900 [Hydrocarboniphaga effusa AP103]MDZ4079488.1 efflux RND transporter periplasmic adaptor subunit [Hydrocarboniphaga sp.]